MSNFRCGPKSARLCRMQCSFCEKQANTVRALVFAPSRAAICDECVDVCNDIIRDDDDPAIGPRCHLPRPSEIDSFVSTVRSRSWEELAHLLHAAKVAPPQRTQYCSFCDEPQDRVGNSSPALDTSFATAALRCATKKLRRRVTLASSN